MRDEAERFNQNYEIGERFTYRPIAGSEYGAIATRTRSLAWSLGSGTAVVMVQGISGCVAISHLEKEVVTESTPSRPDGKTWVERGVPGPGPEDRARLKWAVDTFGDIATHDRERALRFVEEALELAQAAGLDMVDVAQLADRVFDRPPGDLERELGQAGLTLGMLATSRGLSLQMLTAGEFARVSAISRDEWARRHGAKVDQGLAAPMDPAPFEPCAGCLTPDECERTGCPGDFA